MSADRPYVAVVGGGEADADALTMAEEVGRHLAERGAVVLCGGLGGVMEAACRSASRRALSSALQSRKALAEDSMAASSCSFEHSGARA